MTKRKLPIGIQTFRTLREQGCYYVDKTGYARRLADKGGRYFLSRPRRFGKSLFLDTLKELFEGGEPLFRGLAVHDVWDWSVSHPVVRLSFGAGDFTQPDYLQEDLADQLEAHEERAGVPVRTASAPVRLRRVITALHERTGRGVVVLVDEYDKPILDAIEDPELARRNRNLLRGLYGTIKDCDAHVRFSFLTGVSRFSKAGMFSGLNSPEDLTLNPSYSTVCGYTEEDLETVFAPELPGLDRAQIRRWYDGYNWLGNENVYNPYDVLLLFRQREFEAHWFETGTPAFLVNTLRERRVSSLDLEAMTGDRALLSKFDVGDVGTEALLFQSGYLTIKGVERDARTEARVRGHGSHGFPRMARRHDPVAVGEPRPEQYGRDPVARVAGDHAKVVPNPAAAPSTSSMRPAFSNVRGAVTVSSNGHSWLRNAHASSGSPMASTTSARPATTLPAPRICGAGMLSPRLVDLQATSVLLSTQS